MPYISELLNNKITDSSDAVVGRLEDVLICLKENTFDPLEFLEIKTNKNETKFVSYDTVANFDSSRISSNTWGDSPWASSMMSTVRKPRE